VLGAPTGPRTTQRHQTITVSGGPRSLILSPSNSVAPRGNGHSGDADRVTPIVGDFIAWVVGAIAQAGLDALTTKTLGTDQERALWGVTDAVFAHLNTRESANFKVGWLWAKPGPPAAPAVRVSTQRALHVSCPPVSLMLPGSRGWVWCCRGSGSGSPRRWTRR
jgi:hypothetical protein